jgi:zinc transporter ZupT
MSSNTSTADRIIRVIIAIAAVIGAFAVGASSVFGIILFVVAAVMLVTAAIGFCPLYRLFGLSTKKKVTV